MRGHWRAVRGFSLFEVLVVISLIGLSMLTIAGSLSEWQASLNRKEARNHLQSDIRRLRSEAAARGGRTVLVLDGLNRSYEGGVDYAPFNDPPAWDELLFKRDLPRRIELLAAQSIVFDPRGFLIDSGGDLASVTFTFLGDNEPFYMGQIFPTGYISGGG